MKKFRWPEFKKNFKISVLSNIAFSVIWLLDSSYRVKKVNFNPDQSPVIYAVWHGWQYGLLDIHPRKNLHLLVSKSTDGEVIGRISQKLGYPLIRGSKSRGGTKALREILSVLEQGKNVAYTVDGPRGPIHSVQEGIIKIAQLAQVPIVPLVPSSKWKFTANSWDKYQIPYLFAKIVTVFGEPIYVPKDLTDEEAENIRIKLGNELFSLKDQADQLLNGKSF